MVEFTALILCQMLVAAATTYWLTWAVMGVSWYCGAVDWPGHRKIHDHVVSRWGGLAVAIPVMITLIFDDWRLLVAACAVLTVGAVDDRSPLPAWIKLLVQACAASIVLPIDGWWVALIWIVVMTNAWNLIDGVDGLASGLGIIAASTLACIIGGVGVGTPLFILAGSLLGFLVHNWHPAKIFLGDSGAYFVGFLIAVYSLVLPLESRLALCFVPVVDVAMAVLRRGWYLTRPDQLHVHHILLHQGFSQRWTTVILWVIAGLWAWSLR